MAYATINPYTNTPVAEFADLKDTELEWLVEQAQAQFAAWSATPFSKRAKIVHRAAELLRSGANEYAALPTLEMGKLFSESLGEVELAAQILDYYAENAESFLATKPLPVADEQEGRPILVSQPIGVLLGVQPWNFPYYQLARFAAPNIMAGNVVLVKHASIVPQCAAAFERLFHEAGAPPGVYTNLYATKEQVSRLIDDPRIAGVALTGSEAAGSIVASRAGKNLKKTTMELGGSDALVVLPDADLDKSVDWAVWGRMNNGGQCCVASKRIIALDPVADAFLEKFWAAMCKLVPGDPFDEKTTLPPMSSQAAANRLNGQIEEAIRHGATATPIGVALPNMGAFVQPTLLTNVTPDNPVYRQELFGPVPMFFRARDEDDAVRIANDSPYGLGGSVFTRNVEHGVNVAKRIETGMVFINHPTWTKADLPFGGVKRSGYGHELSPLGIQEFVNKKLINVVPIDAPA